MKGLVDAYKRRRGRELREIAVTMNDPAKLDESYPLHGPSRPDAPALERERWW